MEMMVSGDTPHERHKAFDALHLWCLSAGSPLLQALGLVPLHSYFRGAAVVWELARATQSRRSYCASFHWVNCVKGFHTP